MGNLDLKFYWAVFLRRLPYFLVVASLLTAVAVTLAFVLPPIYRSQASMLVEPQQIPDELAETMVPINPFEQVQIIEQRLMTRANLLELAQKIGLDAAQPELSAGEIVRDMRQRHRVHRLRARRHQACAGCRAPPSSASPSRRRRAELAYKGANELVNLMLQENVRLRTGRAGDTLEFFQAEVERLEADARAPVAGARRLQDRERRGAARQHGDAARAQQEREQAAAARARARGGVAAATSAPPWSGCSSAPARSSRHRAAQPGGGAAAGAEEPADPAAGDLQGDEPADPGAADPDRRARGPRRRAARRPRGARRRRRSRRQPLSELEVELAPIDERLKYIAEEKATIEATLAELEASIQATPKNEMVIGGMERDLASLQAQYDAALAEPRPGPGRRADRGAVQGRALQPDRAADAAGQAGEAEAAC